jgi:hypothetical protein
MVNGLWEVLYDLWKPSSLYFGCLYRPISLTQEMQHLFSIIGLREISEAYVLSELGSIKQDVQVASASRKCKWSAP